MSATSGAHDSARDAPTVSVGMPAYNSAAWIESAIESILAQSFRDFELIISDNASTDATLALCEKYASVDSRIRLLRQPQAVLDQLALDRPLEVEPLAHRPGRREQLVGRQLEHAVDLLIPTDA